MSTSYNYRLKNPVVYQPENTDLAVQSELIDNPVQYAKEQAGCRYLQRKVEEDPAYGTQTLYPQIKDSILELMVDSFGNYLVQKLIEFLDDSERTRLLYLVAN